MSPRNRREFLKAGAAAALGGAVNAPAVQSSSPAQASLKTVTNDLCFRDREATS